MRCKKCRRFLSAREELDQACATCLYSLCEKWLPHEESLCRFRGELYDFHILTKGAVCCIHHLRQIRYNEFHLKGNCLCCKKLKKREQENTLYKTKLRSCSRSLKSLAQDIERKNEEKKTNCKLLMAATSLIALHLVINKKRKRKE